MAFVFLQKVMGRKLLNEIVLLGESFTSQQALLYHFVNKIVRDELVLKEALLWTEKIEQNPSYALALTKHCLTYGYNGAFDSELENTLNLMLLNLVMKKQETASKFIWRCKNEGNFSRN